MRSVSLGDSLDFDPVDVLLVDLAPARTAHEVTAEQWAYLRSIPPEKLKAGGCVLLGFADFIGVEEPT